MSNLPFPERVLGGQHMVDLGKTGSGKSSAMRVIVEHLLDHNKRVCIIDPKGDWWGLKVAADGKSQSTYPVICFGDFKESRASDVPINESSGRYVAELVATGNRPCVLGFRGWMPAQMLRFWIGTKVKGSPETPGFAQTIFNQNGGELYIVIDEVHNFAPKGKVQDPESARCLHWTNRIMSEGRGLGLIFIIASQRPQKVHNDTLENCETLIAMRVTHPRSREATEEWINAKGDKELGKDVTGSLADLKRGEAWVWSPENDFGPKRVQFPMFGTFDSFAPPQVQKKVNQASWAEVNLDQVREKLASVIAEQKANDPKELKQEVARLKGEISALQRNNGKTQQPAASVRATAVELRAIEQLRAIVEDIMRFTAKITAFGFEQTKINPKQLEQAVQKAVEEVGKQVATASEVRNRDFDALKKEASALLKRMERIVDKTVNISVDVIRAQPPFVLGPGQANPRMPVPASAQTKIPTVSAAPASNVNGDSELSGPERKIMRALGELRSIGKDSPAKNTVAAWAGYSPNGGAFTNPLGALRSKGMVDYPSAGMVALTDEGRAHAGLCEAPTQEELWRRIDETCSGPEQKILQALINNAGAGELSKQVLAEKSGYSPNGGAFTNPLGALRTKGLLDYPRPGMVKAAEWLFL
jgi:uncharacterized protein